MPPTLRWLGLALLGILIAAGVSIAASSLASQQIGLASQPISAGDSLAPAAREKPKQRRPKQHNSNRDHTTRSPTTPSTTPPPQPEPPIYSEPPSTTPTVPRHESTELNSHDGEHSGGADD
ncbi:MAG TPA: hypothetical protein VHR65_05125 [Solirubrobacterales bacterium]|jgi:hypothetical protein|nr:hypothetical protein [Solirubrobacterales bacterium]